MLFSYFFTFFMPFWKIYSPTAALDHIVRNWYWHCSFRPNTNWSHSTAGHWKEEILLSPLGWVCISTADEQRNEAAADGIPSLLSTFQTHFAFPQRRHGNMNDSCCFGNRTIICSRFTWSWRMRVNNGGNQAGKSKWKKKLL